MPARRWIVLLAVATAAVLAIIGIRFIVVPTAAISTFGLGRAPSIDGLAAVVGIRDLWLAALALAFACFKEWRALALWFASGAIVCGADAAVVASRGGPAAAVAFHGAAGLFCGALAWVTWRWRRGRGTG